MINPQNPLYPGFGTKIFFFFLFLFWLGGVALSTNTTIPSSNTTRLTSDHTNADIFFPTPRRYAVIVDSEKNIRRLYGKGSLLFQNNSWTPALIIERIEPQGVLIRRTKVDRKELFPFGKTLPGFPHLKLDKEVTLTEIRYEFTIVDTPPDKEPFIQKLEGFRAYLWKEVSRESLSVAPQKLSNASVESSKSTPSAGDLISGIQVTKLDENNYEVEKSSLRPLADTVRGGLGSLRESLNLAFSVVTPSRLELTSSIGDATVTQQGFTITRFGFTRTDELGLQIGDRILSINDQSVTSPLTAWGVVRVLLSQNKELDQLRVNIVRDNIPLTKTYRLK